MKSDDFKGYGTGIVRSYIFHERGCITWERLVYVDVEARSCEQESSCLYVDGRGWSPGGLTKETLQKQLGPLLVDLLGTFVFAITT